MKERKVILLIILHVFICLQGCKEEKSGKVETGDGNYFEVVKEEHHGNFRFTNINVTLNTKENYLHGIKLDYTTDLTIRNKQLKRGFTDFGYPAYFVKITILNKNGEAIFSRKDYQGIKLPAPVEYQNTIEHLRNLKDNIFIPYSILNLTKGLQDIIIKIEGFPAVRDSVKNANGYGYKYRLSNDKADAVTEIEVHYTQPLVIKGSLRVCRFCINPKKKDPHSFDYRVLGSGYPDLYWELFTGKDLIYTSPVEKNRITYDVCYNTPPFYFSEKDTIRLAFWDNDELSKPDYVGEWLGSPYELQKLGEKNPEIAFDKVQECKIVLDLVDEKK